MKLTVFGMFTVEGTEKECANYTAELVESLRANLDKQESIEAQKAVDSIIEKMFGTKSCNTTIGIVADNKAMKKEGQ